jgi:predicted ATPase
MGHDFPKPYRDLDETTERVLRACYAWLIERGEACDGEDLRFQERVDDRTLQRLVGLHLLLPRGLGYLPSVLALLYLPEAERDLHAIDALVRLAHEKYRPHAQRMSGEEVRSALRLDQRDFDRVGLLAQELGLGWAPQKPPQPAPSIGLHEWMRDVPDLKTALVARLSSPYSAEEAAENLPAPAPFDLHPRSLRVKGFRALRNIELATPGLTALVGPNGVGKSTLLDAFLFLRNAAMQGVEAAVTNEAGINRLKSRGMYGPVELALEFALDYGDGAPLGGQYQLAVDDVRGRVVVERESLTVTRQDGSTATLIDGRRGRCQLSNSNGKFDELLQSAGTLTLSRLDRSTQETYPIATDLREALSKVVLIDRDPVFNQGLGIVDVGGAGRKRRCAEPIPNVLRAVVQVPELVERLSTIAKEFVPGISAIRRVVETGRDAELEIVEKDGGTLRVEELSAGTRQLLLMAAVYLRPRPPTLVLLEEPDAGVHPGGHTALRDLLRSIAKRSVVVLTTHSPAFVGLLDPETEIMALERGPEGTQLRSLAAAMRQSGWLKAFGTGADAFVRAASEKIP